MNGIRSGLKRREGEHRTRSAVLVSDVVCITTTHAERGTP